MINLDYKTVLAGGAVLFAGAWLLKREAVKAAKTIKDVAVDVGKAVDVTSQENLINQYFNKIYSGMTGSPDTLGEDMADWLHGVDSE